MDAGNAKAEPDVEVPPLPHREQSGFTGKARLGASAAG